MKEKHSSKIFPVAAIIAVIANIFFTYAKAHEGDQGFWLGWVQHIQQNGFSHFPGNYPPVYLLWLWVVAKIHSIFGILLHQGMALKVFCLWPIYISHIFLVRQVDTLIAPRPWSNAKKFAILLAVALNPALLLDGPVWGQVDLLPMIFISLAFTSYFIRSQRQFSFLWFVLALLSKFQTIAFLPVLGALYLLRVKKLWKSIPIAAIGTLLIFLPFILSGSLGLVLENAYGRAAAFYPYATYNAANLWMLVVGNVVNENTVVFVGKIINSYPWKLLSAKMIGMTLFTIISLVIFIQTFRLQRISQATMYGTLLATSFFFLLPQMHERYLLPAIPISLLWLATDFRSWPWVALLSLVSGLNIAMINGIQGEIFWAPLSLLTAITFISLAFRSILPRTWKKTISLISRIPIPHWSPEVFLVIVMLAQLIQFSVIGRPKDYSLEENEQWLYLQARSDFSQSYKSPEQNLSVDKRALTVNGTVYIQGIGTHAPSKISYLLPPGSTRLRFAAGIDDEASGGKLSFRVELDGKEIWSSGQMSSKDQAVEADLDIRDGKQVTLITDPMGDNSNDHADWLMPRIETEPVDTISMDIMHQEFLSLQQHYKKPNRGLSVEGRPLRVGSMETTNGIGTHAYSNIRVAVPPEVCGMEFHVGIDSEVHKTGKALFRIIANHRILWQSDTARAGQEPIYGAIALHGEPEVELETDSLESANSDHTDWLNARFLKTNCPQD